MTVLTLAVLIFLFNPKLIQDVWLWVVGLIGPILALAKKGLGSVKKMVGEKGSPPVIDQKTLSTQQIKQVRTKLPESSVSSEDPFDGYTFTVLRYFSDDQTTLGLFYSANEFLAYTLEDAFHAKKIKGKTRIPSGTYQLDFYEKDTELTLAYRKDRKPWFKHHIKIWDIPNFENVYIHSGSDHTHTEGCLLIARSIYDDDDKKTIFNSKETYKEFYQSFSKLKKEYKNVRLIIRDEDWFESINSIK